MTGLPLASRPHWFDLARAVCTDVGITAGDNIEDPVYRQTLRAYRQATNLASSILTKY
jgi:hypothetical protein